MHFLNKFENFSELVGLILPDTCSRNREKEITLSSTDDREDP